MLAIGREDGARRGFPVVDGDGLVGRIVETGARASRVLLVTDINSRIPVLVGRQAQRAVLQGDNGPAPRLHYLAADAVVSAGDEVYTSGVGGVLPRGLRIGTVIEDAGSFRVQPHARLDELDFVSILQFELPGPMAVTTTPRRRRGSWASVDRRSNRSRRRGGLAMNSISRTGAVT